MPRHTPWLALLWTLFVLYPNPARLVAAIGHAWSPPIDPAAVQELAATLPADPRAIEAAVNARIVPYAVPWQTYGVPWYFPTADEVLARGEGDCQARAIVLASLLRAKGYEPTLVGSFDHLWVDYPGKHDTLLERAEIAIARQDATGSYEFRWPQLVEWQRSWQIEREYFWDAMPRWRLWLLVVGWACLAARRMLLVQRVRALLRRRPGAPAVAS
jgi:hypothetical protein